MAKKTWIKVKRGILDPKHIECLGQAWYLYFYILDNADWETGTVKDWKGKYAADELCKPLGLIREHRKKLEEKKYIRTEKNRYDQIIMINNWTNPRNYDGVVINEEGMDLSEPCEEEDDEGSGQSVPQSSGQSMPQSNDQSSGQTSDPKSKNKRSSSNHKSHDHKPHNTKHKPQDLNKSEFMKKFTLIIPHQFVKLDQPERVMDLVKDFGEDIVIQVANWAATKNLRSMEHVITSMTTALSNGWSSVETNNNESVFEEWINGNKRNSDEAAPAVEPTSSAVQTDTGNA